MRYSLRRISACCILCLRDPPTSLRRMAASRLSLRLIVLTLSVFLLTAVSRALLREAFSSTGPRPTSIFSKFSTSPHLKLPYRVAVRSVEQILAAQWVPRLWDYLAQLETRYVTLCVADSRYTESVVNWLVSALVVTEPPLDNVLIVSLDKELSEFLQSHGLDSVFMDPDTILREDVKLPTNFSHIWATRLVLFRLVNHWGYTLATYDSDALLARNPQSLFLELAGSDLIGSPGVYPFSLHREWKSPTLCMGVVLFRASHRTGEALKLSVVNFSIIFFREILGSIVSGSAVNGKV